MISQSISYEDRYTVTVNFYGLAFLVAVAILVVITAISMHSPTLPAVSAISLCLLLVPGILILNHHASQAGALALSLSSMALCALLIHVCHGAPEAHFLMFALLPLLAVYGRMLPLLLAAAFVALHHLIFWVWLPASVFCCNAPLSMVFVHVFFVVLEVLPMCWIAQQLGRSVRARSLVSKDLSTASAQIASAILDVSAATSNLASGASVQAGAIEETSASITELHGMAERNTENANATADMVNLAQEKVKQTNTGLQDLLTAMESMNDASQELAGMIQVIDQIAFQTNILALNAAVEAARAGDAGSGFAVVAHEVRTLAQRSAQVANDCTDLIEDSMLKSVASRDKVDRVAASIHAITADSATMKSLVEKISLGSAEQTVGIDRISRSIYKMERNTQETMASTEETASAALKLQQQSETLELLVRRLAEDGNLESAQGVLPPPWALPLSLPR